MHLEKERGDRMLPTLSFWCFDPGLRMKQLSELKVGGSWGGRKGGRVPVVLI